MANVTAAGFLDSPALTPPDGVIPNFSNPPNMNDYAFATLWICASLSSIVVALRIYTRFFLLKSPHLGDYVLVIAWALYLTEIGFIYKVGEKPGLFVHQWDIRVRDLPDFLHLSFLATELFIAFSSMIKTAICLEWLHLFCPTGHHNFVFWASWLVLWVNAILCVITTILDNIACTPYERKWNILLPGSCNRIDTPTLFMINGTFNLVIDVAIFIIPQKTIWSLNLPARMKLGTSTVFAIGLFACGAAAGRLIMTIKTATSKPVGDITYSFSPVVVCGLVEGLCGILVLCLPALPKLFGAMNAAQIIVSIRSWSPITRLQRSKEDPQTLWPSSHEFQHINRPGSQSPSKESGDPKHITYDSYPRLETAILRTTSFGAEESYDVDVAKRIHQTRHPWF
ncbi:hypothetical protein PFICI_00163 [Pestalotiopsis fici W106-1]|uniref:Rhodopsin domain-containing protein n=1 Tax=Pestalotiopsis fici (strain W106-1 / CGMCC3.15140) TaxID=1229662 RepID=W3XK09_PESFW|nr:uncharacterized protein PFICI_00163 [Pestalotiopsis fici W106-1]ETS86335.1 hypothetical protein PFICI_00163 [Pestalotiopsis fici W106-1]